MSSSVAQDIRDTINALLRGKGFRWQHTHSAVDGGWISTDGPVKHRNALSKVIDTNSQILNENLNADLWRGHKITVANTAPTDKGKGDVWVDTSGGYQAWFWKFWDGTQWALNAVATVAWNNITGKPSTFPPSAHDANLITSGILGQARGGLGKALDLTGLADTYIIYYDLGSDSWKVEALPAAAPHNLLSATHSDTLADSVVAGDMVIGNATPKWARKALGASGTYPRSNGTDLAYSAIPLGDLPAVPTCRAYATAQQTIGSASQTPINFPAENFDTDTMHDNVTNNSRITIKTAGKYVIAGMAMWNPFVANRVFSRIVLNNTTNLTGAEESGNNLAFLTQSLSAIYTFAVNDYVELQVYQNSVGNQNTYQDAGIASMLSAAFLSN